MSRGPSLPLLLPLSAMYTMKFCLRLKQPVSWFQSEVAFTILKKDRYIFYHEVGNTGKMANACSLTYV